MPRTKKQAEPQLVEQLVSVGDSIEHTVKPESSGYHLVATDVIKAQTTSYYEKEDKQLSLYLNHKYGLDLDEDDVTVNQFGIKFETSSEYKLWAILGKKLSSTVEIKDGEARQIRLPVTNHLEPPDVRVNGRIQSKPHIEVSNYELAKEMFGKTPSGKDYREFKRAFEKLQTIPHCFIMHAENGRKDSNNNQTGYTVAIQYAPVISMVVYPDLNSEEANRTIESELEGTEDAESSRSNRRFIIHLHPIAFSSLGGWFTEIPNDLEEQLAKRGSGRSSQIRLLAYYVLGHRSVLKNQEKKYFEIGRSKLISKLNLDKYRNRRKDLDRMVDAAFKALEGYLIDKVEILTDRNGGIKYRIYPLFDAVKEIKNGAA
jgi:hypothetical protein